MGFKEDMKMRSKIFVE